MPKRSTKTNGRWDWPAAMLVLVILQIAAARLVATKWTADLNLVQAIVFFGGLLGLALGFSVFSRTLAGFFATAYGIFIIPWQLGLTLAPGIEWVERLSSLRGRIELVVKELIERSPVTDNLLFLLLMALLFWVLSVYVGFILVRYGHIWRAVLPGGLAAFVIHTFDARLASRSWFLAFYLFFALLLVARLVYLNNRAIWKQHHTHVPPDIGFDMARFAAFLALVVVLFAWNVPVVADSVQPVASVWRSATHPWMSLRDRLSFVFASLRASVGLVADIYGDNLPLGLGTPLTDEVIMEVEAPRDPPHGVRYYWRARVFTVYDNNEWEIGLDDEREFLPGGRDLSQPGVDARAEATFTFFPHIAISTLYVAPQPLWVSRPSRAVMVTNPDGTVDVESLRALDYIRPGEQYEVRSSVSAVTIKDLRAAGTDYPQWVLDRYLQLPDDITPRTYELAQTLARGQETPYDVAEAVTNYLRETITYQLTIDAPPADVDRIDWFLFEYQKGFCNYYATSEVILLRSLGIPARIAVGFAQGERETGIIEAQRPGPQGEEGPDPQMAYTSFYIVRQKNAHTWPEVYFPGIGWVEFEPTSGQDPLFRPSGEDIFTADQEQPEDAGLQDDLGGEPIDQPPDSESQAADEHGNEYGLMTTGMIIRLIVLGLCVILLIWVLYQTRKGEWVVSWLERFARRSSILLERGLNRMGIQAPVFLQNWVYSFGLPPLSRAYMEINRSLHRLGGRPRLQDTPSERGTALIEVLPTAKEATNQLLAEYQAGIYSLHTADEVAAHQASITIKKLSYLSILRRFLSRFQEPEKRRLP